MAMCDRPQTMASSNYLNLYVGNHGKLDGVKDYITLITRLLGDRGIRVEVSSALNPQVVNLIIDEFTNYAENCRITAFRKANPDCPILIILTEFTERKWGVESFNNFGNIFNAATIALADVYLRLIRDDFGRIEVASLLKLLCFSPLLILQAIPDTVKFVVSRLIGKKIAHPLNTYARKQQRIIYLHMRYLGLKACLGCADAVIASHEKIINGFGKNTGANEKPLPCFGVLYPEFDESDVLSRLMIGKKLFIEITGSITSYRKRWIKFINQRLVVLGLHNVFGYCVAFPFAKLASGKRVDRGAYSLHPPQTRTWPYCSPTRIYRALSEDYNLPILTHHFHQNPIEDVCFVFEDKKSLITLYEMYSNPALLRDFIEPRLKAYNTVAITRNNNLVEQVRGIMRAVEQAD